MITETVADLTSWQLQFGDVECAILDRIATTPPAGVRFKRGFPLGVDTGAIAEELMGQGGIVALTAMSDEDVSLLVKQHTRG